MAAFSPGAPRAGVFENLLPSTEVCVCSRRLGLVCAAGGLLVLTGVGLSPASLGGGISSSAPWLLVPRGHNLSQQSQRRSG